MNEIKKDYLTTTEAAVYLGIAVGTLRNKMTSKEFTLGIHFFKPGGMHPRWKVAALAAWVERAKEVVDEPSIPPAQHWRYEKKDREKEGE